ncbi:MAG TPA: cobalamin B12-binding domain-containing protein, partial [Fervidobacterium sp.]|nr:cobalamin B12-binding domain-containing protein [Fervidobacterium sp.]
MKILGGSIGSCVHSVGILNFLKLANENGYETVYVGTSLPVKTFVEQIKIHDPDIVAISYRLGGDALENLLRDLEESIKEERLDDKIYIFGGTFETARVARRFKFIKKVIDGTEEIDELVLFLRGESYKKTSDYVYPQTLGERIRFKAPFPLIRHHIGLQGFEETVEEIRKLAESELLDIISVAPDQNCQQ